MIKHFSAAFVLAAGSLASTPALAAPDFGAAELVKLCPATGPAGLAYGVDRAHQDAAALKALGQNGPTGAGEAMFTTWSGKLYGAEWRKESPDGDVNTAWLEGLDASLREAGWELVDRQDLKAMFAMEPRIFTKVVEGRQLMIQIDAPGIQLVSCTDLALSELDRRERDEDLAEGSPRPQMPPAPSQPASVPDPKVCATPELIAAFSESDDPKDFGPTAGKYFQFEDPAADVAEYEKRLGVWLRWKLRTAGGMSQEEIWALDKTEGKFDESLDASIAMLDTMGQAFEAGQTRDGRKKCEATIELIKGFKVEAEATTKRERKSNAILEAEAARRGIAIN